MTKAASSSRPEEKGKQPKRGRMYWLSSWIPTGPLRFGVEHFLIGAILFVLADVVALDVFHGADLILLDSFILVLFLLAYLLFFDARLGKSLGTLLGIKSQVWGEPIGDAINPYIRSELENLEDKVKAVVQQGGKSLEYEQVKQITGLCFTSGKGMYVGTDSNSPSQFYEKYPGYLPWHEDLLRRTENVDFNGNGLLGKPGERGTRILTIEKHKLTEDDQTAYREFLSWHKTHHVGLYQVDPSKAQELKEKYGLETTDVGMWGNKYGLLFVHEPVDESKIKLQYVSIKKNYNEFLRVWNYFQSLLQYAKVNDLTAQETSILFGKDLYEHWSQFVACSDRMETEGKFLKSVLPPLVPNQSYRILDAAAGIGCESIFLEREGYDVTPNEIEPGLASIAKRLAREEGEDLSDMTAYDWRNMDLYYKHPTFKVVLVLGNSICLLHNKADRLKSIRQFFNVLLPGGMLVIDERNFTYIVGDASNILKNPVTNFRYSGKVVYCGASVHGVPTKIGENVEFLYFETDNVQNLEEAKKKALDTLNMHPFVKSGQPDGELPNLLREAGFKKDIEIYSDKAPQYVKGYMEDADFFTYIARKPD
jgi:SAM-dependent methyltransferase